MPKNYITLWLQPTHFILGLYIGLWLPDFDLVLLPLLHHRSIISHSVILPLIVLAKYKNSTVQEFGSGLLAGIAIHLAADGIPPLAGFGQVYLPWPIKQSIGEGGSLIWLIGNAAVGVWFIFQRSRQRMIFLVPLLLAVALAYAVLNEDALVPFLIFGAILTIVVWRKKRSADKNIDGP